MERPLIETIKTSRFLEFVEEKKVHVLPVADSVKMVKVGCPFHGLLFLVLHPMN